MVVQYTYFTLNKYLDIPEGCINSWKRGVLGVLLTERGEFRYSNEVHYMDGVSSSIMALPDNIEMCRIVIGSDLNAQMSNLVKYIFTLNI